VKTDNYKFFSHKQCEFYPCHEGYNDKDMNCLWCYCPLQTKPSCPGIRDGSAKFLSNGYKDCSNCTFPHDKENYNEMLKELNEMIGK